MRHRQIQSTGRRDYAKSLAATLNNQDRKGILEWLAGIPLDRPSRVQGFRNASRETKDAAVKEFLNELRRLADQWIASGTDERDPVREEPWSRNVFWCSDAWQEPIEKALRKFLDRHPLPIIPDSAGRFKIAYSASREILWPFPEPKLEVTLERARDHAIFEFQRFLESDCPQRLFRCNECKKYFARDRKPREVIQHGAYCKNCKSAGGARRVEKQRDADEERLLRAAADAWVQWKKSPRNPDQRAWVATQVSERCGLGIPKQRKWVSRNMKKILQRIEVAKNAKS